MHLHSGNLFELPSLLPFLHLLCGVVLIFSLWDTDLSPQSPDRFVANPRTCPLCRQHHRPCFWWGSKCWAEGDYCWARRDLICCFVGAQTKSGVSLSVLEQKFGWAEGLCFPPTPAAEEECYLCNYAADSSNSWVVLFQYNYKNMLSHYSSVNTSKTSSLEN